MSNTYIKNLAPKHGIYHWRAKKRPELIFMQDNASIHTAHKVKDWFEENGIQTTNWPPYSPDLNPIKHA
jgi:transposase